MRLAILTLAAVLPITIAPAVDPNAAGISAMGRF